MGKLELSSQEHAFWFSASQGSRIIPLDWFQSLPSANLKIPFASKQNLRTYGLIIREDENLPIGFAIDAQDSSNFSHTRTSDPNMPWLGLTCAACHTSEIRYKQTKMLILGAPARIDLQSFLGDLYEALERTLNYDEAWLEFKNSIEISTSGNIASQDLRRQVKNYLEQRDFLRKQNATRHAFGYGRTDAFGQLINRLSFFLNGAHPTKLTPNAPVNFPHLWNAHRQEYVQWNASARNRNTRLENGYSARFDIGALGRNVGQVLGVFGDIQLDKNATKPTFLDSYASSLNIDNLKRLEAMANRFTPPSWPRHFPPIETKKAAPGAIHYKKYCQACHLLNEELEQGQGSERVFQLNQLPKRHRTDKTMACNALTAVIQSGVWKGRHEGVLGGKIIGDSLPGITALDKAVKGVIAHRLDKVVSAIPLIPLCPIDER